MSLSTNFRLPTLHTETTTPRFKPPTLHFLNVGLRHYQIPCRSTFVSRGKDLQLPWKCSKNSDSSSPKEDDDQALQAVLKLYNAIKNKNVCELSEIFGEESRCWCNFIPFFHSFRGKEQVMIFFSYLIKCLGSNIVFVFQPVSNKGMTVGVTWKIEWNKSTVVPLGKGFSFHICHAYEGKVVIRNVEVFMEPLLHFEPFKLKMADVVMAVRKKTRSLTTVSKVKTAACFGLFMVSVFFILSKFFRPFV